MTVRSQRTELSLLGLALTLCLLSAGVLLATSGSKRGMSLILLASLVIVYMGTWSNPAAGRRAVVPFLVTNRGRATLGAAAAVTAITALVSALVYRSRHDYAAAVLLALVVGTQIMLAVWHTVAWRRMR